MAAKMGPDDMRGEDGQGDDAVPDTDECRSEDYEVGHKRPPKAARFAKGVSGNPRGRPKGRKPELPHEAVLGRMITIRKDGREQEVTAEEAFLLHIGKAGLDGDGPAARATLEVLERTRVRQTEAARNGPDIINLVAVAPGSVTPALEPLRMARRLDAYRQTARIMLEPWLVEAALKRLGSRKLTVDEQRIVIAATRTPNKVRWPVWWVVRG